MFIGNTILVRKMLVRTKHNPQTHDYRWTILWFEKHSALFGRLCCRRQSLYSVSVFVIWNKSSLRTNCSRLPKVVQRRATAALKSNCAFSFQFCLLHTSQSPDNLLIIPRHLDKRKRKRSLFFHPQHWVEKYLRAVLEPGVRVKQSCGHLTQDSNRFPKSGDNANSDSNALAIIACCKIGGSLSDNCPGS